MSFLTHACSVILLPGPVKATLISLNNNERSKSRRGFRTDRCSVGTAMRWISRPGGISSGVGRLCLLKWSDERTETDLAFEANFCTLGRGGFISSFIHGKCGKETTLTRRLELGVARSLERCDHRVSHSCSWRFCEREGYIHSITTKRSSKQQKKGAGYSGKRRRKLVLPGEIGGGVGRLDQLTCEWGFFSRTVFSVGGGFHGAWRCEPRRVECAGKVKAQRVPRFFPWLSLGVTRRGGSVTRAGAAFGLQSPRVAR
jgi:hypothetical protein